VRRCSHCKIQIIQCPFSSPLQHNKDGRVKAAAEEEEEEEAADEEEEKNVQIDMTMVLINQHHYSRCSFSFFLLKFAAIIATLTLPPSPSPSIYSTPFKPFRRGSQRGMSMLITDTNTSPGSCGTAWPFTPTPNPSRKATKVLSLRVLLIAPATAPPPALPLSPSPPPSARGGQFQPRRRHRSLSLSCLCDDRAGQTRRRGKAR